MAIRDENWENALLNVASKKLKLNASESVSFKVTHFILKTESSSSYISFELKKDF